MMNYLSAKKLVNRKIKKYEDTYYYSSKEIDKEAMREYKRGFRKIR